jgi:hypothetical protein
VTTSLTELAIPGRHPNQPLDLSTFMSTIAPNDVCPFTAAVDSKKTNFPTVEMSHQLVSLFFFPHISVNAIWIQERKQSQNVLRVHKSRATKRKHFDRLAPAFFSLSSSLMASALILNVELVARIDLHKK